MSKIDRKVTVDRLRQLAACKIGDPFPDWMTTTKEQNWGTTLSGLCRDAANLIEDTSAGKGKRNVAGSSKH